MFQVQHSPLIPHNPRSQITASAPSPVARISSVRTRRYGGPALNRPWVRLTRQWQAPLLRKVRGPIGKSPLVSGAPRQQYHNPALGLAASDKCRHRSYNVAQENGYVVLGDYSTTLGMKKP